MMEAVKGGALVNLLEEEEERTTEEGTSTPTRRAGRGALHHASVAGHLEAVKFLVGLGADVTLPSGLSGDEGAGPLHLAVVNGRHEVVRALLKATAPVDSVTNQGNGVMLQ
ncbi:protein phosphatase 1 regulatory subunit 27-like isoform X2 [Panulirus ornatus]